MSVDFQSAWDQAGDVDQPSNELTPPEPGTYDVAIDAASAFISKKGNPTMTVDLRVVSAQENGYEWRELRGFDSEGKAKAAKSVCSRLGIPVADIASIEQLDEQLKQRVGEFFEVEIVQNGDFRNVYVQGAAQATAPPDVPSDPKEFAPPAAPNTDDEPPVPF